MTKIDMDWTDTGAVVMSTIEIHCPRCQKIVTPNIEHRCGDKSKPAPQPKRKVVPRAI